MTRSTPQDSYRCGYVALAGRPNVGKSTLLNALVGQHLSIVSSKAQTTRERVAGLRTTDLYQILFIDAPGLIEPRYALQEAMRWAADSAIEEADVVVFIVDATRRDTRPDEALLASIQAASTPVVVAVNKSDAAPDREVADLLTYATQKGYEAVSIAATTGEGLDALLDLIVGRLPTSPPLFPPDEVATQPVRFFAEEFVRETCMEMLREEVPYSVMCRVEEFRESQDPVYVRIHIYVERESQKGIVIGKGGSTIKQLGERSRAKIEELIGRRVYLDLRVKVMRKWSRRRKRLEQLGFRLPPERSRGGQAARQAVNNRG